MALSSKDKTSVILEALNSNMTLDECIAQKTAKQSHGGMGHLTGAEEETRVDKLDITNSDIQILLAFKNTLQGIIEKEALAKSNALKKRERSHSTNIRKTTLERMKKRLEQKNRERSQKYLDEIKRLKKEIKSLTSKRTTKSNSKGSDTIKEAKSILRKIKFYGRGELNMERVGDLRELFGLQRYG